MPDSVPPSSPPHGNNPNESERPACPEDKQLSSVLENYLEIIFYLEMNEGAARASSIAESANVSRSTVTSALKSLKNLGYVEYEPYSLIHLTESGLRIGRDIAHRHMVFQEFFQQVLQFDQKTANNVACELEHVVPLEVIRRVGQFVLYLNSRKEEWQDWQAQYAKLKLDSKHQAASPSAATRLPPALALRGELKQQKELDEKYR